MRRLLVGLLGVTAVVLLTRSDPIKINQAPDNIPSGNRQAFTPSVHVSTDGTVGVTYYDFRNNTPDPGTLPTDYFIVH